MEIYVNLFDCLFCFIVSVLFRAVYSGFRLQDPSARTAQFILLSFLIKKTDDAQNTARLHDLYNLYPSGFFTCF